MAYGIDIYEKYQTVTNWARVKDSGVSFVYIKGTDGGGQASVPADSYVRGAKSVGLPVGLYHYAELSPTPEAQADVLTAEVRRLGATGLPPALDLESPFVPGSAARSFAQRFLRQLKANGFNTVTLYANTSMLSGIGADTLGVDGVKIWAANYGANDGAEHGYSYAGHVDVHQYTSVGTVPGINGRVDMNNANTDITNLEDDVSWDETLKDWDPPQLNAPAKVWLIAGRKAAGQAADTAARIEAKIDALAGALSDDEANIIAAVRAQVTDQIDVADLSARLTASLGPAIAAELGRRLTEGNPA